MTKVAPSTNKELLFKYVWNDDQEKLSILLEKNDPELMQAIDEGHYSGLSALLVAAMNGRLECMKLLAARGANLLHRDLAGRTALHWAAYRGHDRVVQYLINECNGDTLALSNKGYTPIDMARRSGFVKLYAFLINFTAGKGGEYKPKEFD